jgi:hypothetical protein
MMFLKVKENSDGHFSMEHSAWEVSIQLSCTCAVQDQGHRPSQQLLLRTHEPG